MFTSRRLGIVALVGALLLAAACTPTTQVPDVALGPSRTPEVFIFPGETEKILISTEDIPQNNCDGSAEMSQEVERSYTVRRTLDLGTQITVDASGQAGIPGVGQVGVGVAVANFYQVSYGSEDAVARAVVVKAKEGTSILHTIRQYEIWETGNLLISVAGVNQQFPYRFRKDFSMETLPPANIGCPGQAVQPSPADAAMVAESSSGSAALAQPATAAPLPTNTPQPPPIATPAPACPFLTNSHINQLRTAASVSDALKQAEEFANHQQNDYAVGSTIPTGVVIATDLQNSDLSQFPVSPIRNQGGWGLFVTTGAFSAPNAGTYWCIQ